MSENLEERERRLVEREEELERLQQDIERREEDLERRARAVSPLNDRERRADCLPVSNKIIVPVKYYRSMLQISKIL